MVLQLPSGGGSVPFCVPSGLEGGVPCRLPLTPEVWAAADAGLGEQAAAALAAAAPATGADAAASEPEGEMSEFRREHLAELAAKKTQRSAFSRAPSAARQACLHLEAERMRGAKR